jgi:hypothetical protein
VDKARRVAVFVPVSVSIVFLAVLVTSGVLARMRAVDAALLFVTGMIVGATLVQVVSTLFVRSREK